jgi:hypothetical protein
MVRGAAAQQFTFDDGARYKAEVEASSSTTIPPGTQITTANWKQYQNFLPVGIQALYSGQYGFKVGDGPDFAMTVGSTIPISLPKEVLINAEKYGHQSKLTKLPSGGYGVEGYVAGIPFPNPSEPELGTKIMFNLWYDFWPFLVSYHSHFFIEDRYGNTTPEESIATTWQLMHLSDPAYPINLPYAGGFYHSTRDVLLLPEQSKYTTALDMQRDDPSAVQETYVFLPSLRRPLRLSSAARCSPILGTDWAQDDNAGGIAFQVGLFNARFARREEGARDHSCQYRSGHRQPRQPGKGASPGDSGSRMAAGRDGQLGAARRVHHRRGAPEQGLLLRPQGFLRGQADLECARV